ncbi:MAG: hypothetical protein PHQ20_04235, partial [Candidatus Moranbacteria bacterium]|nr:hypothetical protein [Candidatus Moranbacteria bacterium]
MKNEDFLVIPRTVCYLDDIAGKEVNLGAFYEIENTRAEMANIRKLLDEGFLSPKHKEAIDLSLSGEPLTISQRQNK